MVKIDEIEDFYKKGAESLDKEFLEKLSKTKVKKDIVEKEYKRKIRILTEEYNKKISDYIKEQKKVIKEQEFKKLNQKKKKDDFKYYEVKKLDLNETWKDRLKFNWELYKFNQGIKSKNFKENHIPENFKIFNFKLKIYLKNLSNLISRFISDTLSKIKKLIINISVYLKETFLLILKKSRTIISWFKSKISLITSKISKNKTAKETKEKRPDEEIAEKLLKKKIDD